MKYTTRTYDPMTGSRPCLFPSAYLHLFRANTRKSRSKRKLPPALRVAIQWAEFAAVAAFGAACVWAFFTLAFLIQ